MSFDEYLSRLANTGAAVGLLVVSLAAILLMKDRKLSRALVLPVVLLVFYLVFKAAADATHNPSLEHGLVITAGIFFAFAAVRVVAVIVLDWFLRNERRMAIPKIVRDLIVAGMYGGALFVILRRAFDIDLTSLFTSAALLSVVLGLGLQDTLGGVFAGLALQMEPPFDVGDWVSFGVGSTHTTAKVSEVSWRVTRLVSRTGDMVVVPNAVMSKTEITNYSKPTRLHARYLEVGLPVDIPPSVVRAVITQSVVTVPGVLPDPPPGVRIKQFADSSIIYLYYFYIDDFDQVLHIEADVQAALWYALRRADISLPSPVRDIYMHQASEVTGSTVFREAERLLAQVDFLKILDEDMRRALARRMRSMQFGAGETIVKQGEQGETFYIVAEGEVGVRLRAPDGVERRLGSLQRGNFFGEMSLLTGDPRSATVIAKSDTLLLAMDREGFRETLLLHPEIAKQLAEMLSQRANQIAAVHADAAQAQSKEQGRIMNRLKELFKLG